jgi:hypothetical protein
MPDEEYRLVEALNSSADRKGGNGGSLSNWEEKDRAGDRLRSGQPLRCLSKVWWKARFYWLTASDQVTHRRSETHFARG